MVKKNLIVFDIDGTLTDTVDIHQSSFKKTLQSIGIQEFNNSFENFKHHTDSYIAKSIYESTLNKKFNRTIGEIFEESLYEYINQHNIYEIKGAKKFLNDLETKTDFGICFATGSLYKPAVLKLKNIGVDFEPLQLVTSNMIEEREQIVSEAINNARKHYKTEHFKRIISFGDGIWDLSTAKNLNIEFIGIGNSNKDVLEYNGMERHYFDFENFDLSKL